MSKHPSLFLKLLSITCCMSLALAALSGCSGPGGTPSSSGSGGNNSIQSGASQPDGSSPDTSLPDPSGSNGDQSTSGVTDPGSSAGSSSTSTDVSDPGTSTYDFSQPVPESPAVDNSYFEDAAFIGDSRTDGFLIYSGIGCGENLTSNGISIFKLAEKKALTINGQQYTLLEALALKQYGKVYISLGVNELGYYDDPGFYRAYCNAIDSIRACQPNAVIYIQGLIPLNEDVIAATGGASYLTNEHLLIYNDLMKQVAQEKQVAFLDLNPEFAGPDGQLPADASRDGVHLSSEYCRQWLEYLQTHTVDYDTLYPTGAPQLEENA